MFDVSAAEYSSAVEYEPLGEALGEINRKSRQYIRWVQRSLNQVLGAGLAVDGIRGRRTRRAIRRFQQQAGLIADSIVGRRTEAALVAAGVSPPPGAAAGPVAAASLADLDRFSRRFIRDFIAAGRRIDCADLAIELWILFGQRYGLPVAFKIWDSRRKRWLTVNRRGIRVRGRPAYVRRFGSTSAFVRYVQGNLGARGLAHNTYPVPGGHRSAVAGDVFLWKYRNNRTGRMSGIGHTQIFDRLHRTFGVPASDQITIAQGSLPPIVPYFRTYPAAYFYHPRSATISGEPHIGLPVGSSPRRFMSFRYLR